MRTNVLSPSANEIRNFPNLPENAPMYRIREGFQTTLVAQTGAVFHKFSPYVASINNHNLVCFQAEWVNGHTGIYTFDGHQISTVVDTTHGFFQHFYSHPDLNDNGAICFYAVLQTGQPCVGLIHQGDFFPLAQTGNDFAAIGPLGPTVNEWGAVAFRAQTKPGIHGIFKGQGQHVEKISDTSTRFAQYFGLPVIDDDGTVVFRAEEKHGIQGIYASDSHGRIKTVVDTSTQFQSLGYFPALSLDGAVLFHGILDTGKSGVFAAKDDVVTTLHSDDGFESYRGVLMGKPGHMIFYATPRNGRLGIYCGTEARRVLSVGDAWGESFIEEFALNPVSINEKGGVVIRIKLLDQTESLLLLDTGSCFA